MINDFYLIYEGLRDAGKEPVIKHNNIASPGMGTTFRVCLDENGTVYAIEHLTNEKIKDTWSIGDGNKNQFPAVKFEYPIIPDGHKEYVEWKKQNKNADETVYRQFLKKMIESYSVNISGIEYWPQYRTKILNRIKHLETPLFSIPGGDDILELFRRYRNAGNSGRDILVQFAQKLKSIALGGGNKETLKAVACALFGDSIDKKGRIKDSQRTTLLIDCLPQQHIDIFVSSRKRVSVLSEALFVAENAAKNNIGCCAITGQQTEIVSNKFPSEKLNVIGNTILLTKNSGTSGPTVSRYGASGVSSFPLGKRLSEKISAAILFLTSEQLRGITWKSIPSPSGSKTSLLLAYCRSKYDMSIIPAITGGDVEDFDDYQDAAETVISLIKKGNCTPDDSVAICEVRYVDDGNRKINYSTISTVGKISRAANEWVSACKNIPTFKLFAKIKKQGTLLSPWSIAPVEILYLTKKKYIRNGLSSSPVNSLSLPDAMVLFMSNEKRIRPLSLKAITKLADQVAPLFNYCALSKNLNRIDKKMTKPDHNTVVLKTVTLFGALLYKFGRRKEEYMTSFAFQFGQLCSAIDELHIGYCQSERKGDIPNSLIGNMAYNMALQNPTKAMGVLASRITPYKLWAKRTRSKQNKINDKIIVAGLAASKWIESHSETLMECLSSTKTILNDTYKAELMLGYLAGRPFLTDTSKQ